MKTLALVTIATLVATSALAQNHAGSGQRAGGPAYLTNRETGGKVKPVRRASTPEYLRRSGSRAGGPANELNTGGIGPKSAAGTVKDPAHTVPFGTALSGQRAGGSYRH